MLAKRRGVALRKERAIHNSAAIEFQEEDGESELQEESEEEEATPEDCDPVDRSQRQSGAKESTASSSAGAKLSLEDEYAFLDECEPNMRSYFGRQTKAWLKTSIQAKPEKKAEPAPRVTPSLGHHPCWRGGRAQRCI